MAVAVRSRVPRDADASPPTQIEFWFDFGSPYGYFASKTVEMIAAANGCSVTWRPFLLGPVFGATGMSALSEMPLRGDYAKHDWERLARGMNLPFRLPTKHPIGAAAPCRAYYWIARYLGGKEKRFAQAVFDAYFEEDRDVSDQSVTIEIAARMGIDPVSLNAAMNGGAAKRWVRAATAEALRRGIFGSPFFIVDGEPFWGQDRLPMIEEWISNRRR